MSIPSDEDRHDGNMAPANTITVSLLRKGLILAGCPFHRTKTVTMETWRPPCESFHVGAVTAPFMLSFINSLHM
jgi:hypothetical protein